MASLPSLSRSPSSPPGSYLKHLAADRGTSQLEAVGNATGASLGLMGLWVAPHSTQHEAVLHSWSLYIFHMLGKVNTFLIWGVTKDVIHLPSIFFVLCALTTSCKELSRIPLKASRTQCGSRRPCDLPQEVLSKRQHSLVSTLSQIVDYFANLVSRHKWRIHVPCVPLPKLSCRRLPASMPRTRQHERLEESEVKGADMALT